MFVKLTKSGPRSYVQLVEAYRDDAGRPKQRTVATLGRLDQIGESVKSMHDGLARLLGIDAAVPGNGTPSFDSARALGDVWALTARWKALGLDRLGEAFRSSRHRIDLEALLRIMVLNRLCDADSKLGVLRWLQTVSLPEMALQKVGHQQLLRTMDALIEHQPLTFAIAQTPAIQHFNQQRFVLWRTSQLHVLAAVAQAVVDQLNQDALQQIEIAN
jgi:hypothetical protein